jgi:hypothetical protein
MRLFWACTHLTLRDAEIPLFLSCGFEAIPEEPDPVVLDAIDFPEYESDADPVTMSWRRRCTAPERELEVCRRARLSQRGGLVSEAEQDLFNAYFDVIYIATNLKAAANIKSWFRGEVIFRYFGFYSNLRKVEYMASSLDADLLGDILYAPIYSSLQTQETDLLFRRTVVLRPFLAPRAAVADRDDRGHGGPVVTVLSSVYSGWENERDLKSLLPLTDEMRLHVLGKNDLHRVASDIKTQFHIVGASAPGRYREIFHGAQMCIYGQSSSHHMHYTPLEAVAAGVPLVCRGNIPLLQENQRAYGPAATAGVIGVAQSHEDLLATARRAHNNSELLAEIAASQRSLMRYFCADEAAQDLARLSAVLRIKPRQAPPRLVNYPPLSSLPTNASFETQAQIASLNVSVRAIDLIADFGAVRPVLSERPGFPQLLALAPRGAGLRLTLGEKGEGFDAKVGHAIELRGRSRGRGALKAIAELWRDGTVVASRLGIRRGDEQDFVLSIAFCDQMRSMLLISLQGVGDVEMELGSVSHWLTDSSSPLAISGGFETSPSDVGAQIRNPSSVAVALLPNLYLPASYVEDRGEVAVRLSAGADPSHIPLFKTFQTSGMFAYVLLEIFAADAGTIDCVCEAWGEKFLDRVSMRLSVKAGHGVYIVAFRNGSLAPAGPFLHFSVVDGPGCDLIRIWFHER